MAISQVPFAGISNPVNFRNRIINGDMQIDQRNGGASVTANDGTFDVDRWKCIATANGKFTMQQNAGSVTPPAGFTNYLGCTSSSAYSVSATDFFHVRQGIEGYNVSDLAYGTANAKTTTLSFWVRSSLTGTFGGSLNNSAFNRSYPYSYTISSANTWEYKTVTIAGDTSGTWLTTNGVGLAVSFSLGAGSTQSGTAGAWVGSEKESVTGATSVVGTNGATLYITGVQLEAGDQASGFEFMPIDVNIQRCRRYYEKFYPITTAPANGAGNYTIGGSGGYPSWTSYIANNQRASFVYLVPKRASPTVTFYRGTNTATAGKVAVFDGSSWIALTIASSNYTADGFWIGGTSATTSAGGNYLFEGGWGADCEL